MKTEISDRDAALLISKLDDVKHAVRYRPADPHLYLHRVKKIRRAIQIEHGEAQIAAFGWQT